MFTHCKAYYFLHYAYLGLCIQSLFVPKRKLLYRSVNTALTRAYSLQSTEVKKKYNT